MRVQRYDFLFVISKIRVWNTQELTLFYSISRSGIITKSRSCMCGWGSVRRVVDRCRLSYMSMSMSIGRSWYCPSTDFKVLPSLRSMSCVTSSTASGDNDVCTRMHIFKNLLADSKPHGSVSIGDDSRSTQPTSLLIRCMARRIMAWRSPRLEPSER